MLNAMRDTGGISAWWQWFVGDWFLYNGFYRPVTCLSLLLDYTLYGEDGWGYRLTNWLLALLTAVGCYVCLQWFARRWLSHLLPEERYVTWFATSYAVLLSIQQTHVNYYLFGISAWWIVVLWLLWCTLWWKRHCEETLNLSRGALWWRLWLAAGAFFWGWDRLVFSGYNRLIVWVPSRTALLMTCLCIWCMWSLLRWWETGKSRYLLIACVSYAGACGAYEQALMLAPLVGVLAFVGRREWRARSWLAIGCVLAIAVVYVTLRFSLLPTSLSGYQQQQLRSSYSLAVMHFVGAILPITNQVSYWVQVGFSFWLLFSVSTWNTLVASTAYAGVLVAFWHALRWFGWWLLWHALTFLPMTFLHPFEHYYYLPQIGQNAVDMGLVAWGLVQLHALAPAVAKALSPYLRQSPG